MPCRRTRPPRLSRRSKRPATLLGRCNGDTEQALAAQNHHQCWGGEDNASNSVIGDPLRPMPMAGRHVASMATVPTTLILIRPKRSTNQPASVVMPMPTSCTTLVIVRAATPSAAVVLLWVTERRTACRRSRCWCRPVPSPEASGGGSGSVRGSACRSSAAAQRLVRRLGCRGEREGFGQSMPHPQGEQQQGTPHQEGNSPAPRHQCCFTQQCAASGHREGGQGNADLGAAAGEATQQPALLGGGQFGGESNAAGVFTTDREALHHAQQHQQHGGDAFSIACVWGERQSAGCCRP